MIKRLVVLLVCASAPCVGQSLEIVDVVHHADVQNREPMLAELSDGTLLVSGFPRYPHEPARAPSLWRSGSGGNVWGRVYVGMPRDGARGNSDTDFALGPDGAFYYATMGFNRATGEGTHVAVGVTRDNGNRWSWITLVAADRVDRPWVDVAPDGTVHVVWNDGNGVHHRRSSDGGITWRVMPPVHPLGGSSHMVIGPAGELAVRVSPTSASGARFDEGVDLIAVSTDGGESWRKRTPPGPTEWGARGDQSVPRWVEPLEWDASGRLYYLWSEGAAMWLARSTDRGETWERWEIAEEGGLAFYPFMTVAPDGTIAASWFTNADDGGFRVALIVPSGARPRVAHSVLLPYESWAEVDGRQVRDPNGEYAPALVLSDGDIAAVTPLHDPDGLGLGFTWWRLRPRSR